ncbi:DUF1800 domain-containing protein [Mycolicibacterium sp. 018/SC-01/001]|uniref:DUF1800 domain-containing protein n=1 Tax=Mycolicibacterium sp. 018/SC-01/001 TaxID=2592069 RepID=UPI003519F637
MTARLLRRMGFGTTGEAVDAALGQDWAAYVDRALAVDPESDPGAVATPMPTFDVIEPPGKSASVDARKQYQHALIGQLDRLAQWWLARMAAVQEPVGEKLTLLWHNHFATSALKVRNAPWMAAQNRTLRALCLADFHTLSSAMLTDSAMLQWLDAQTNTARSPNENLAREFMELFALGHGNGYSEGDVRSGARALTGWVVNRNGPPSMVAKRHDDGVKTFLGVTGDLDAAQFCDIVLAQPYSASYVTGRLWGQLYGDDPTPDQSTRLVGAYGPGRDLRALTRAILTDQDFVTARPRMVNTPVEWLVGVARSLGVPLTAGKNAATAQSALRTLGQRPFYPPDVGGWPHGQVWLSTASASQRFSTAAALAAGADLSTVEQAAPRDRLDAAGYLIGIGDWTDRTATALAPLTANPHRLVAAAVNTPEYLTS